MAEIIDPEFGTIAIRRSGRSTSIRLRLTPHGTLRASAPLYMPLFMIKRLVTQSRPELRKLIAQHSQVRTYRDGMQIGKSHSLLVRYTDRPTPRATRQGLSIMLELPEALTIDDPDSLRTLREAVATALRIEAKSYLPKRLRYLADQHGFSYERVRFSHASGRWGSCSTTGTISLNIALMMLPFELIDYVLIHELSHTKHMNHSPAFWDCVALGDPAYKQHRTALKSETPSI